MGKINIILPKMGESVAEATVTSWLVEVGEKVEVEDGIMEIATDKVDSEIPSTHEGTLIEQLCKVGDVVQVGQPVAIIEIEGEIEKEEEEYELEHGVNNESNDVLSDTSKSPYSNENRENLIASNQKDTSENITSSKARFYSPLVKNIAVKEGINQEQLDQIQGTGKNNRVTKNDILHFIKNRGNVISKSNTSLPKEDIPENLFKLSNTPTNGLGDEVIEMDRIRKLIAKHMLHSKQVAPHVTSFVEADVTNLVKWREKIKGEFTKKEGFKITFTPIFIEAVAKTLRDFPMVNISIEGDQIIVKKDINIGMAVALPSGNLIVPVIKNADTLNLIGISKRVNELAIKARNNKLSNEDVKGGTFTITNAGTFGNVMGTPIINQPEVAIMATGIIEKKPAVLETEEGDVIAIRHKMFLSMSYDHRVVDGMLGGSFLKRVSDYLENFDINRKIW